MYKQKDQWRLGKNCLHISKMEYCQKTLLQLHILVCFVHTPVDIFYLNH